jgi:hypothetical protein
MLSACLAFLDHFRAVLYFRMIGVIYEIAAALALVELLELFLLS